MTKIIVTLSTPTVSNGMRVDSGKTKFFDSIYVGDISGVKGTADSQTQGVNRMFYYDDKIYTCSQKIKEWTPEGTFIQKITPSIALSAGSSYFLNDLNPNTGLVLATNYTSNSVIGVFDLVTFTERHNDSSEGLGNYCNTLFWDHADPTHKRFYYKANGETVLHVCTYDDATQTIVYDSSPTVDVSWIGGGGYPGIAAMYGLTYYEGYWYYNYYNGCYEKADASFTSSVWRMVGSTGYAGVDTQWYAAGLRGLWFEGNYLYCFERQRWKWIKIDLDDGTFVEVKNLPWDWGTPDGTDFKVYSRDGNNVVNFVYQHGDIMCLPSDPNYKGKGNLFRTNDDQTALWTYTVPSSGTLQKCIFNCNRPDLVTISYKINSGSWIELDVSENINLNVTIVVGDIISINAVGSDFYDKIHNFDMDNPQLILDIAAIPYAPPSGFVGFINDGTYISLFADDYVLMKYEITTMKMFFPGEFEDNAF